MSKIISLHSFRGGTGKSNITSNIANLLFEQDKRVGIIDSDIESPGIHVLFGIDQLNIKHTLNDYLWKQCSIKEAAIDVTDALFPHAKGKLYIIPSSLSAVDITKILREGYDIERLIEGYHQMIDELKLDYLLIDTHPGINEETLLSISISDILFVIMRPDKQDYQGTAITVELAKKLEVPSLLFVVNKVMPSMDSQAIQVEVENAYDVPVAAVLPFSEEMILLASSGLFTRLYPEDRFTKILRSLVEKIS
jgi:MinD-like ATPase involved in chromosome partitioning or flagellar assembly